MDYQNWSREELLKEVARLRKILDEKGELRDHETPKIQIDIDLDEDWSKDKTLLQKIFSHIAEFVYLVEFSEKKEPTIRFASPHIHHIYGISRESYLNDTGALVNRIHPDDFNTIKTSLEILARDRQPITYIYRFLHGEKNEYVWLEETICPQINAENEYKGNLGIIRDVTARIEAIAESRKSRESFKMFLDQIDEVIYHFDFTLPKGEQLLYVSRKIEELLGVPYDAYILDPKKYIDNIHPSDMGNIKEIVDQQRKDGLPKTLQYRFFHHKNREYIWLEEYILQKFSETGEILSAFGIVRNITKKKYDEGRLKESEGLFRMLAENATDVIFRFAMEPEPHYEYVSPSIEAMTGYTPNDFYANPLLGFQMIHPEDKAPFQHSQMVIEGKEESGTSPPVGESYAVRWIRKDGTIIWTETRNRPILDQNRRTIAVEGISRDISQAKHTEQELIASREHYRTLIEQSPDGIIILNTKRELVTANQAAIQMLGGTTEAEFLQHNVLSYVNPIHKEKVIARLKRAAAGESVPFEPLYAYSARGEELELETKPMQYTYMGKPSIIVFIRDVTTIRRLEKERLRLQVIEESNIKLQAEIEERIRTENQLLETKENLRQLIDSSLDMIIATDMSGFINEFNSAAERIIGYDRHEAIGMNISSIYVRDEERNKIIGTQLEQSGYFSGEILNKKKNGEEFISFLSASIIRDANGRVVGAMGISRDISDRISYERELKLSEEKYRAIFDQAYTGIALVAVDGGAYMEVNETFCKMLGYERQELLKLSIKELHLPGDLSRLPKGDDFIRRGFRHIVDEHRYLHRDGTTVFVSVTITLVRGDDNKPLYFVYVYEDLTPKRKAEEQLSIQAAKLNAIIESSSHIIWTIDKRHKLTSFNKNQADWIRKAHGLTPYIGMDMLETAKRSSGEYGDFWENRITRIFQGEPQHFELPFHYTDGSVRWREIYLNPISDDRGNIIEASCIAHDITDKKQTDEKIRQSLKEKEVLLKEVHHRVKNNLQVISSILNLQSAYVKDKKMLELLHESRNRIKSMAFVHESLYQTKDFSNIDFKEYIENISRNLLHSYGSPTSFPELDLDLDQIQLNLDTAVPCGLIVNELLSNSFKYAFKDGREGKIEVRLRERKNQITLKISDNGPGMPENIDYRQTESLGLQLVVTLVEQINGKIKLENKKGAKFTIEFTGQLANS
jgi:PAS domain S-box-containing protein